MGRRRIAILAVAITLWSEASGQCTANGLTLVEAGNRLGDPFSITLSGSQNAPGLLGADLVYVLVTTSIGYVCLGLSPALSLSPFVLDPAGQYTFAGLLPLNPTLNGLSAYLQAAAVDPAQPSGSALSNSVPVALRSPRVHV